MNRPLSYDRIIPALLVKKNFDAYAEEGGLKTYQEFPRNGHFICGEPNRADVAGFIDQWLRTAVPAPTI